MNWKRSPLRVLDFDIEVRPLSYLGQDYTTGEVTAIAAGWVGEDEVACWALGEVKPKRMLTEFLRLYEQADIVTGHYVIRHDLPILSGALFEFDLGRLPSKLVSDTQRHLVKHKYLSASQESLAVLRGLSEGKEHMTQPGWRQANRLEKKGVELSKARVVGDVVQHKAVRAYLVAGGYLASPTKWSA